MAVAVSYVPLTYSQWVQVCEYRETRTALVVSILPGHAIFGIGTDVQSVDVDGTATPCGIWQSAQVGTGPATFDLSLSIDGELTWQAWYVWIPGSAVFPTWKTTASIDLGSAGPVDYSGGVTGWLMWLVVASATTGDNPCVVTSAALGALVPRISRTLLDGGEQLRVNIYEWIWVSGDTITFTYDITFGAFGAYIGQTDAAALDAKAQAVGSGSVWTGTTLTPAVGVPEPGVYTVFGLGQPNSVTITGDLDPLAANVHYLTSGGGSLWSLWVQFGEITQQSTPTASTMIFDLPFTDGAGDILTYRAAPTTGPDGIATVYESFSVPAMDDPEWVDPTKTIRVELPKLSRAGVAALHDLLGRIAVNPGPDEDE